VVKFKEEKISIINKDSRIEGQLHCKGHLVIEGTIEGSIDGESILTEKDSHITAKVHAQSLTIAGFIKGDIEAYTLTILKTAKIESQVRCHRLIIDEGGISNGSVKFLSSDQSP